VLVGVGLGVRVGVAGGVTIGVAVGNSATEVAVGAGPQAASSEMLRHTTRSEDLMFLLLPTTGPIQHHVAFRHRQVAIFAFLELSQFQRPDGDPHQPQHAHVQRF